MSKFSVATAAPSLLVLVMVLLCCLISKDVAMSGDVEFYWTYWTERGTAAKILWTTTVRE